MYICLTLIKLHGGNLGEYYTCWWLIQQFIDLVSWVVEPQEESNRNHETGKLGILSPGRRTCKDKDFSLLQNDTTL